MFFTSFHGYPRTISEMGLHQWGKCFCNAPPAFWLGIICRQCTKIRVEGIKWSCFSLYLLLFESVTAITWTHKEIAPSQITSVALPAFLVPLSPNWSQGERGSCVALPCSSSISASPGALYSWEQQACLSMCPAALLMCMDGTICGSTAYCLTCD